MTKDPLSFQEIYDLHKLKIYRLALRFVQNPQEAEDVTQQVFLKVLEKLDKFRGDSNVFSWIYRMAMNACVDHIRRKQVRRETSLDAPIPGAEERGHSLSETLPEGRPEPSAESKERDLAVRKALFELDEKYREVIILRDLEGLSYEEVTELLHEGPRTVAMRIFRARKQLEMKLKDYL